MPRASRLRWLFICVLSLSAISLAQNAPPPAADQDAQAMLQSYRAMQAPQPDLSRRNDQAYVQSYVQDRRAFELKKADLAKAFHDKFPKDPAAAQLMQDRWMTLAQSGQGATVLTETDQALSENPDPAAKPLILFPRAVALLITNSDKAPAAIDEFVKAVPDDQRGAELLFAEAERNPDKQADLYHQIVSAYPKSQYAQMAQATLRRTDSVGQPFDLAFTDAISGKPISVQKDLKGKVVVIDFWATWCGPCVAEMPKNKEIYAQYKDKGVEFIGVSLDQPEDKGGLKALKDFVAANNITWPQYYQGNYWQSEFSSKWGIDSIPCVFILDADGKLFSVTARGQLEDLIPKLLAMRDKKS
jgi:thiol-disulfide isomerase/thioredoxin